LKKKKILSSFRKNLLSTYQLEIESPKTHTVTFNRYSLFFFKPKKYLVLDLDETLLHSTFELTSNFDFAITVE